MRRLEGLADIRRRAGEDALRAAMRVQHGEMEIKAAQRAAMGLEYNQSIRERGL